MYFPARSAVAGVQTRVHFVRKLTLHKWSWPMSVEAKRPKCGAGEYAKNDVNLV